MKINKRMFKLFLLIGGLIGLFGCRMGSGAYAPGDRGRYNFEELEKSRPQCRVGSLATNSRLAFYNKSSKFGKHDYMFSFAERNGMIYTCRGGHIDLAHLRNVADWTGYIASKSYKHLNQGDSSFSFNLNQEGECFVEMEYPAVWNYLSEDGKAVVSRRIAGGMGEYFSYQFSIWHEMTTWFGYKSLGIYPEFSSAFSWEDTYSNLLGSRLGYLALNDSKHSFNRAVTLAIDGQMQDLCLQSKSVAKKAARYIRSKDCKDYVPIANYRKRNFDIGLDDGYVTPWIIPSAGDCKNAVAQSFKVPTLEFLDKYDFTIKFTLKPNAWEKDQIFRIVYDKDDKRNFVDPALQFAKIMIYIEQMAMDKYGMLSFSDSYNGEVQLASQTK